MPNYSPLNPVVGIQQPAFYLLPDTTARQVLGTIISVVDPWWGGAELMYCRANGTVSMAGLVVVTPVFDSGSGSYFYNVTDVPNTANLGRMVGIAMTSATAGQYLWVLISGVSPVKAQASVAADTTFGITAAGAVGAVSAGKQILSARCVAPSATTVVKAGCTANAASNRLLAPNTDGWFIGCALTGTGIAASTVIVDIDPSGTIVTLNNPTTAAVNGSVTATYTGFNIVHLNRSFAQGQII